jgi:hypothetical protein
LFAKWRSEAQNDVKLGLPLRLGTQAAEKAEDLFKELGSKEPARKVSK